MKINKDHAGSSLDDLERHLKKDPEFRFHLEEEEEKLRIAALLRNTREKAGFTQRQLAQKSGVLQPAIARIEGWTSNGVPSIDLLNKLFSAMGYKLVFGLEKMRKAA